MLWRLLQWLLVAVLVPFGAAGQGGIQTISDDEFESAVLRSAELVVVFYWAEWCGPCRMMMPSLDDISHEMRAELKVVRIDIDKDPKNPRNYNIRSIPTLLIFKDGKVLATKIGAEPKQKLVSWITTCLPDGGTK